MDNMHEIRKLVRHTLSENYILNEAKLKAEDSWEIHDDKGMILKGIQEEMIYAWNINSLAKWAFEEIYGTTYRNPKWIIKEFYGSLRLIQIIDERKLMPDLHKWKDSSLSL